MTRIIRILIGIFLTTAGLWGLNHWHYMLWISGGPDRGPNQAEYIVPYFVTSALAVAGFSMLWRAVRNKKNN